MEAASVCPSFAAPEMAGETVDAGATAATVGVGSDDADAAPDAFAAVTTTRIVDPTSTEATPYVDAVAPEMSVHAEPDGSHLRH